MIKGCLIKVIEVMMLKMGKYGYAKCYFIAFDIFINKKVEEFVSFSYNFEVLIVNWVEYILLDIDEDDYMFFMDDKGDMCEDLKFSGGYAEAEKLVEDLRIAFDDGKEV